MRSTSLKILTEEALRSLGAVEHNLFVYYVYILKLRDGSYYVGFSANLKQRILEHNLGKVKTTKELRPTELIQYSAFKSKYTATAFERYLKQGSGFAFRNKHLI